MISPIPNLIRRIARQPLQIGRMVFIESIFHFFPLELKKSPRSPRAGSPGSFSGYRSQNAEKCGNQIMEAEMPQTSANLRVIPRSKPFNSDAIPCEEFLPSPRQWAEEWNAWKQRTNQSEPRKALPLNRSRMLSLNQQPILKGSERAAEGEGIKNRQCNGVFLQSFKSCRGHHFITVSSLAHALALQSCHAALLL